MRPLRLPLLRRAAGATARASGATAQWQRLQVSVGKTHEAVQSLAEDLSQLHQEVSALRTEVIAVQSSLARSSEQQAAAGKMLAEQLDVSRGIADHGSLLLRHLELLEERVATRVATHQLAPALTRAVRAVDVDAWSLLALRDLLPSATRLPPPGGTAGWAATPETLLLLVREVLGRPDHPSVVECGSGTSTVWLAAALAHRGGGHVVAVEHAEEYADQTRTSLHALDLHEYATVVAAPLAPVAVPSHETPWYGSEAFDRLPDIVDILFVDGPPGATGPAARLPALPLLQERLGRDAVVVLDDTDRPEEREVLSRWVEGSAGRLVMEYRADRATLLRWRDATTADGGASSR